MKTLFKTLMAAFIFTAFTGVGSAQNNTIVTASKAPSSPASPSRGQFRDTNNNGVCDNFEARGQSRRGANFVDKNGDGICDNRGTMGRGNGCGKGFGKGDKNCHRHGRGHGNCYQNGKGSCK
ncbi:MAG: hypothetical protein NT004_12265 [Bacteroidetes bacterium]|nr:hypothetical protein [Bacteroidota bacterium]